MRTIFLVAILIIVSGCGIGRNNIENALSQNNAENEDVPSSPPVERFQVHLDPGQVRMVYILDNVVQARLTMTSNPQGENFFSSLWVRCCSVYPPARPAEYIVNSSGVVIAVNTTVVSSRGRVYDVHTNCINPRLDYEETICRRGQEDYNRISVWLLSKVEIE